MTLNSFHQTKNRPCPKCREIGRDNLGDNLFRMDKANGWACRQNGITHEPYYEWDSQENVVPFRQAEDINMRNEETIAEVIGLPIKELPGRKIRKNVCEKYEVRVSTDISNGEIDAHYYPVTRKGKVTGFKVRTLPKQFKTIGDCRGDVDLFGQFVCPQSGKRLLIVGGELDCLAAYQMLKDKYPSYEPAVVSLPKGETTSGIKENLEFIKKFEEVIVYTDMDEVGRKVADDICKLIGPKAKIMSTSEKDASDMLVKGKQQEFLNAYFSAEGRRPEGIVSGNEISLERIKQRTQEGYEIPYPQLSRMLGGIRKGEITTLTAGSGVGKSTLARELGYHLRAGCGLAVGNMFLEEPLTKTIQGYIAIDNNVSLSQLRKNPNILSSQQWKDSYDKLIAEKWYGLEHFGSLPTEDLMDKMRHLAYGEKCDFIILDHLSMVFSGQKNDNERLSIDHAMTELAAFTNESGVGVIVVVHLSRNKGKTSFNEGGQISLTDLRGSAALEQLSWNVIGLERDTQSEDNMSIIRVLKNRENGWTGQADKCEYNFDTGRLLPIQVDLSGSI